MKKKLLILLPIFLAAFYLYIFPAKTFAAEWAVIGSSDKQVQNFIVDRTNKNIIIYSNVSSANYRTEDGGAHWQSLFIASGNCSTFLQSNQNPNEFWAGCSYGLHHSTDKGKTFNRINNPIFTTSDVRTIRQGGDGTLYVTTSRGAQVRSKDGIIWENLSYTPGNIFADTFKPKILYSSSNLYGSRGLYRSGDYGATWTKVNGTDPINNGFSTMLFFEDRICATTPSYGYGCSHDEGITWIGFQNYTGTGILSIFNHSYHAVQNPDDLENVFVTEGDVNGATTRIYSITKEDLDWKKEQTPSTILNIKVSQGVVFGSCFSSKPGLWSNPGIATIPEYLKKHPVIVIPGFLGSWEKRGKLELDPKLHTYDTLYFSLKESGMEEEKWLFSFPYNWRKDNKETARLLKEKIDEAKLASGESKVDIVAHSMGGLVARAYAQSDYYENDIDQIIFLGTPHLGSAKSFIAYESGNVIVGNNTIAGQVLKYIFNKEAEQNNFTGENKLFEFIRARVPSLAQLLPITSYLEVGNVLKNYPEGYPKNQFLEELDESKDLLNQRKIRTTSIIGISSNSTIHKYSITPSKHLPLWEHGEPINFYSIFEPKYIYYTSGDETVITESASSVGNKIITLSDIDHNELAEKAINEVENELVLENKIVSAGKLTKKAILSFVHSPIDVMFTDPLGRRVGTAPVTKQEINEIPGAFYTNENGMEFAVLPNTESGEYSVTVVGTGDGDYKIETHYIDEELATDLLTEYFGETEVSKQVELKVNLNIEDKKVETKPEDENPPLTEIDLVGENYNDFYRNGVNINLEATDEESGVEKTLYSFDGVVWEVYKGTVNLEKEGENDFYFYSTDKNGNKEEINKVIIKIDRTPPYINLGISEKYSRWDRLDINPLITDKYSCISSVEISLDGVISNQDRVDLFEFNLGKHFIKIRAWDFAGNCSELEKEFKIYTDYHLTLRDISWALAGIKNPGLVISLGNKIELALISGQFGKKDKTKHFLELAKQELSDAYKKGKITEKCYRILLEDINYLLEG